MEIKKGKILRIIIFISIISLVSGEPVSHPGKYRERGRRAADQRDCSDPPNPVYPPTVTETTQRLANLRSEMEASLDDGGNPIRAYIVPTEDAHQSGYISLHDKRRVYISGFTGSSGLAVVTHNQSAIYVDGRYWIQVEREVDCNWLVMRSGEDGVPSASEWLAKVLPENASVGFDPKLLSRTAYFEYEEEFTNSGRGIVMHSVEDNLIDNFWKDDGQPARSAEDIFVLDEEFTGKTWNSKIDDFRSQMSEIGADMLVIYALDETAWLFNMRGGDIPYNPVFLSYTIITLDEIFLYIEESLISDDPDVNTHISPCPSGKDCVQLKDYDDFFDELQNKAGDSSITQIWFSSSASYAIYERIPEDKMYMATSPILITKAIKNQNEIDGMIKGNLLDSVAVVEFIQWIETQAEEADGDIDKLSELIAQEKVAEFRSLQPYFVSQSFAPTSGFGENGAVIHYKSSNETNKAITKDGILLLDTGGQYSCGTTTDVTRSFHFGKPTDQQKEGYTRVLMGQINFARMVWREGEYSSTFDAYAREALWRVGWDYNHGTDHGIGSCLNVHESRGGPLAPGMFMSDEPGVYLEGEFGVRLENDVMVVVADTQYNFNDRDYLTFETMTLVPYDINLIKYELLSDDQLAWLNEYNTKILQLIGQELMAQGKDATYDWLVEKTQVYERDDSSDTGSTVSSTHTLLFICFVTTVLLTTVQKLY